jgi:hypothetical protein
MTTFVNFHIAGLEKTTRLGLALNADDMEAMRYVRARLAPMIGKTSYVAVIRYALRLAVRAVADMPEALPPGLEDHRDLGALAAKDVALP